MNKPEIITGKSKNRVGARLCILAMTVPVFMLVLLVSHQARACSWCCDGICEILFNSIETELVEDYFDTRLTTAVDIMNEHMDQDFQEHQQWMIDTYFEGNPDSEGRVGGILPAMMMMTNQFSAIAMQQMEIVGTFLDAKHELETQRLFQQLAAEAHKDYHPSEGLCAIGTAARNLQGAERDGDVTALMLTERSVKRQLKNANSIGAMGDETDSKSRRTQFLKTFCDPNDDDMEISKAHICAEDGSGNSLVPAAQKNSDIDFSKTLWEPLTLQIDFSSGTATKDTENVLALQNNLYGHDVFTLPTPSASLKFSSSNTSTFLESRAVIAKRSVALNTFSAIAAMKTAGSPAATSKYFWEAYKALNPAMTDPEATAIVGANPSYWAQMEVLTKTLLQNPQFYTDLYDKPANVERKRVALEAISLMQERDNYKVALRSEVLWSMLLEMKLTEVQSAAQNSINDMKGE